MSNREDAYRLYQGGMMVAAAYGPDSAREIVHYANVYLSEGDVYIVRRKPNGRWPKFTAQVDTHAERRDVEQARPVRVGSAVRVANAPKGVCHG